MTLLQMTSDDRIEYFGSSEDSETHLPQLAPEWPRVLLSTYMTTFGHFVLLYRGAIDVWVFIEWSTLVATLFQGEEVPQSD